MFFSRVFTALLLVGALAFALPAAPASAQMAGTSASGMWKVRPTSNPLTSGVITLRQQGHNVIGSYGKGGTVKGTVNPNNPHELDLNWSDQRGTGWSKITFGNNWNDFHGQWGYPGQAATGEVYAGRMMLQINTAGVWNVRLTGQKVHNAKVAFQQKGTSFVGKWTNGHITGTIPAGTTEVNGTWQTIDGSGPLHITFSPDGNHFSGFWAYSGKANKGRIFGTRVNPTTATVDTIK